MAAQPPIHPRQMDSPPLVAAPSAKRLLFEEWSPLFLSELAATSNVTAAARMAGIAKTTAYETRRTKPEFNRQWQHALCEGYDHLEMELLHRLRKGELKSGPAAKRTARQFDNATAFRLLSVHRETAARQRALRDNEDTEAILASIDRKLEKMRERRALKTRTSNTPTPTAS